MKQWQVGFDSVTHVIFDMDGLLLDTETKYETAIENVCEKYGSSYSFEAQHLTNGLTDRDGAEVLIRHLNLPMDVDKYLEEIEMEYTHVFKEVCFMPGAEKLIRHLSKHKMPIAIATNSKRSNFERKTQSHAEIFKEFSHVVFGGEDEEVKNGKPAPDVYQVAARRFSHPPQNPKNVLVFEDAAVGVTAGRAAGMQVVWVPHPRLDLKSAEATLVLNSLENFQPELFGLPNYDQLNS